MTPSTSIIYHDAYISEIAALPLALVAVPAAEQKDPEQQVCFRYGSQKPIIVYKNKKGGLYDTPVNKWRNTENGHEGYGVLELLSDVSNRPMLGADLKQMCKELVDLAGMGADILDNGFDYRENVAPQQVLTYYRKPGFNVEELQALGCSVYLDKNGVTRLGFACPNSDNAQWFAPNMLHSDFRIYALSECVLPQIRRDGEYISERIISTPFNPLFICFADAEEKTGCVFRPGMPGFANVVFSKNEDITTTKVGRWLGGDKVFIRSLELRSKNKVGQYTGYLDALEEFGLTEDYRPLKEMWHVKENGKQELITVTMEPHEIKADNIIFCKTIADAISTYYHLNALSASYPNSKDYAGKAYHVCFNYASTSFSAHQYSKMHGFAHRIYTLFPNDSASIREARMIGKKYREIYRAALPESFFDVSGHCSRSRIFQHAVNSVRDFFLVFKMDKEQAFTSDYDINRFFLSSIISALPSSPLKHVAKKDKNGETKDDYWVVNAATIWEFMASEGYCRVVENKDSIDKVGRFYHLDFPFFDELDRKSMVSATRQCLREYAKTVARPDSTDFEKLCDAIEKAREISDKTIDGLPLQEIDYRAAYNEKLDYFYYRNCALRITPDSIQPVAYNSLNHFVNRSEVLPWDYHTPFLGNNVPFTIEENPEYRQRKEQIETWRNQKTEDGKPAYTDEQIKAEEDRLENWAKVYRWKFDFRGKPLKEWWPPLLVLRGFANEYWQEEKKRKHRGEDLTKDQIAIVDAHLANLLFCLARPLFRYHGNSSYCAPYLMENSIQQGQRAQGGSGKSTFVNTFMGCCGYILTVDAKSIIPTKEVSFAFSELIPRHHRVVHIEDLKEKQNMQTFYNYVTSGFKYQRKFENPITLPHEEAPGLIISSNYALNDMSNSTTRRFPLCGFSDRFCGENVLKSQRARDPVEIMKDFTSNPEYLSASSRNQIAYICAIGVQMIMRYNTIINIPTEQAIERTEEKEYGKSFMEWQKDFFARMEDKQMYGVPIDIDSCFVEYMDFVNTSEKRESVYSPDSFRKKVEIFCNDHNMVVNPPQIRQRSDGSFVHTFKAGTFRLKAWKIQSYFVGKEWENDPTVHAKKIREIEDSKVIFIYKADDPNIPADYEEQKRRYKAFIAKGVDPDPILDEDGNPYELTDEERERWRAYTDFKQGKRSSGFSGVLPAGNGSMASKINDKDLPF